MNAERERIRAQKGFQVDFLSSPYDILIGGGSAGVGKTFALLLDPLRYVKYPGFQALIFRKSFQQIKQAGALWSESVNLYGRLGAKPNQTDLSWRFAEGSMIKFGTLENETKAMLDYQGSQFAWGAVDELTHISETLFFFLISRNRSAEVGLSQFRATCNPDPDSFVKRFIDWWIDEEGWPIKERCGKPRFFIRISDAYVWGGSKDEVISKAKDYFDEKEAEAKRNGHPWNPYARIKSVSFIPGSIYDNAKLLETNPGYLGNLEAMSEEGKLRFLHGNWKIKIDGDMLVDYMALKAIVDNQRTPAGHQRRYITCDASTQGRDFTVIMVWEGFVVTEIHIFTKDDPGHTYQFIEGLRGKHNITRNNVLIDADGVGNPIVKMGGYDSFHGGHKPKYSKENHLWESYPNYKTQCYYNCTQRINKNELVIRANGSNITVDGKVSTTLRISGAYPNITDLIQEDFRAIRRKYKDGKHMINTKDEQKIILGRSPDFSDTVMMREHFELRPAII